MPQHLDVSRASLILIDWQERLFSAMPETHRAQALTRARNLRWLAGELGLPVLASEQYPKGLGPTLAELDAPSTVEKTAFSAAEVLSPAFTKSQRDQVLVSGMETHICVAQTCRDLLNEGKQVWLIADACLSRKKLDWALGIERIRQDGAQVLTTEAALFELLADSKSPLFKEVSKRIR